ncbi:3'-5' exoribonuclease 1-like [Glandiceps talaboti]
MLCYLTLATIVTLCLVSLVYYLTCKLPTTSKGTSEYEGERSVQGTRNGSNKNNRTRRRQIPTTRLENNRVSPNLKKTEVKRKKVNNSGDQQQQSPMASKPNKDFSNPVYKEISLKNGEINRLNRTELIEKLSDLKLDADKGSKDVLRKRLKAHVKKQMLAQAGLEIEEDTAYNCPFDYLLVIDFEATCERDNTDDYLHEIIEFPVVMLNAKTLKVDGEFHSFCKPILHPKLSSFCTELTGITQEQVESSATFSVVFQKFEEWLKEKRLGTEYSFAIVTHGPWDIICFLHVQCALSEIPFPDYAKKYINIRNMYSNFYKTRRLKISQMLEQLGMSFHGREHSGLADSRNIKRILVKLMKDGCIVAFNAFFNSSQSNSPRNERKGSEKNRSQILEKEVKEKKQDVKVLLQQM